MSVDIVMRLRAQLNAKAKQDLRDTIEGERACGDRQVADAIEFLLERHALGLEAADEIERLRGRGVGRALDQARTP